MFDHKSGCLETTWWFPTPGPYLFRQCYSVGLLPSLSNGEEEWTMHPDLECLPQALSLGVSCSSAEVL